jgi:hypothetical protein
MDNGFLWLVVVAVVIGVLIYFGNRGKQQERLSQTQERLSQLITPLDHFADLAAKGIQIKLIAGEPPNIALRIGEHMLCVFPNTTLLEPRAVRTWLSNYGGASIRVAKGLSFRAGQSRGVSESHDEMRAIDLGTPRQAPTCRDKARQFAASAWERGPTTPPQRARFAFRTQPFSL